MFLSQSKRYNNRKRYKFIKNKKYEILYEILKNEIMKKIKSPSQGGKEGVIAMKNVKSSKERARAIFDVICQNVYENCGKWATDEENLMITFNLSGDDMLMCFRIKVDEEAQLVKLVSFIPLNIPKEKRNEFAFAICGINNRIIDGNFDYNPENGAVIFRITNSFRETEISSDVLAYMMDYSAYIVDKYNDKLNSLSLGEMSIEKFMEFVYDLENDVGEGDVEKVSLGQKVMKTIYQYVSSNGCIPNQVSDFTIKFTVCGKDIPMEVVISVDPFRQLIRILSPMPYGIAEKHSYECALAICNANFGLADGCFEYNARNGIVDYRTEVSYVESDVNEEMLGYMIESSCEIIDKYNDKFLKYGA
jgi:hypothetical protein